jgi:hypothetical protein
VYEFPQKERETKSFCSCTVVLYFLPSTINDVLLLLAPPSAAQQQQLQKNMSYKTCWYQCSEVLFVGLNAACLSRHIQDGGQLRLPLRQGHPAS